MYLLDIYLGMNAIIRSQEMHMLNFFKILTISQSGHVIECKNHNFHSILYP